MTPKETRDYEEQIAWLAKAAGARPHDLPCRLFVTAGFPVAVSWSLKKKMAALSGLLCHTSRPDADNIGKAVADSLNGVAYRDDALVYHLLVSKAYSNEPGLLVRVEYVALG